MKNMKLNMNMIMTTIFLCGILLVGIGVGVAFGEYSALEYGGEKKIGTEKLEEITLEQEIATGKNAKKIILYNYYDSEYMIKEDKKVPEGVVRYEISYNPDYIKPELEYHKITKEGYTDDTVEKYDGEMYVAFHRVVNEVELFMEFKDEVLTDLKNGKISAYPYNPIEKVVVKVNPKTMKYIEDRM